VLHKTLIAFVAAVALGCVPMATTALAAHGGGGGGGHGGGHASGGGHGGGHAGYARGGYGHGYARGGGGGGYYAGGGPLYNSCGYGYNACPGYGIPFVGGLINGALGGY
jgi:hypothetical protein